jgi:single-strand DNA-binding protein
MATAKAAAKQPKEKQSPVPPSKEASLDTPAYKRNGKSPVAPAPSPETSQPTSVADRPATPPTPAVASPGMRMPTINDVKMAGRLTDEPEMKSVGKSNVANFRIAVQRPYMDAQKNWQKEVTFVPVALWGAVADRAREFLHKGSPVYLEGRLRTSSWQTKDGQNRSILRLEAFKIQSLARGQSRSVGHEIGD